MIRVKDLRKNYGTGKVVVRALRGVDLQVERGEFVSVVGPSGCGKSTLLYILGGLLRASGGVVEVDGFDVTAAKDAALTTHRRESIGFVFQKFNLMSSLNVFDNLRVACKIVGRGNGCGERIERILESVGIAHKSRTKPLELSQGEQQRVAIARALIKEPKLLLVDEPTGNLDSENSDNVMRLFKEVSRNRGQTILMITHNLALAEMTDRIVMMKDGLTVGSEPGGVDTRSRAAGSGS
jgi:putative ABC transport system ATP-binding protein